MSQFRVGMRVRILGCEIPKERALIGREALIVEDRGGVDWILSICWLTRPDVNVVCRKDDAPAYLAPILDQHQPCDADFKRDLDRMLDKEEVR